MKKVLILLFFTISLCAFGQTEKQNKPPRDEKDWSLGIAADKSEKYKKAFYYFNKGAEKGDPRCQEKLGEMYQAWGNGYLWGPEIKDSFAEGLKWWNRSAAQGNIEAKLKIAGYYDYTAKNKSEAFKWYKSAAEQEIIDGVNESEKLARWDRNWAIYEVGNKYSYGDGVGKNEGEAAKWFRKGAELGDKISMRELGDFYFAGRGVSRNYAEAMSWYLKAYNANKDLHDDWSAYQIGWLYDKGLGCPKNDAEAVKWYKRSGRFGGTELGFRYANGKGVKKDLKEAVKWYGIGTYDKPETAIIVADIYMNQLKDYTKAYEWYLVADRTSNGPKIQKAAEEMLKKLKSLLTPQQIQKAKERAFEWCPKC